MHLNKIWQAVTLSLLLHALMVVWLVQRNRTVALRPAQPLLQFEMAAIPRALPVPPPPLPPQSPEPTQAQTPVAEQPIEEPVVPKPVEEPVLPKPVEEPLSVPNKPVPKQKPVKRHKPPPTRSAQVVERATSAVKSQPLPSTGTTPAPSPPVARDHPPDWQAAYANNPKPTYPPAARRMGHEGTVFLTVDVTEQGGVEQVTVQKSSGFDLLDRAAIAAVKGWHFLPAQRNGHPVAARVTVPIRFQLQQES